MAGLWIAAQLVCCATAASAADLSAEAAIVSDYRYRGLSLSDSKPAIQASATVEHVSGLYASLWASTIKDPQEEVGTEVDLAAGYAAALGEGIILDVSVAYFAYPGDSPSNYFETTAVATAEISHVSASIGVSFVPGQKATRDECGRMRRNAYIFAGAEYELADTPVTFNTQLGYERGWFDQAAQGGKWDWSLGGELMLAPARLGLTYLGYRARDISSRGMVASLAIEF